MRNFNYVAKKLKFIFMGWGKKKKVLSKPIKSTNIISGQMLSLTLENKRLPDKH